MPFSDQDEPGRQGAAAGAGGTARWRASTTSGGARASAEGVAAPATRVGRLRPRPVRRQRPLRNGPVPSRRRCPGSMAAHGPRAAPSTPRRVPRSRRGRRPGRGRPAAPAASRPPAAAATAWGRRPRRATLPRVARPGAGRGRPRWARGAGGTERRPERPERRPDRPVNGSSRPMAPPAGRAGTGHGGPDRRVPRGPVRPRVPPRRPVGAQAAVEPAGPSRPASRVRLPGAVRRWAIAPPQARLRARAPAAAPTPSDPEALVRARAVRRRRLR